jgi:DNA-binding NarL/FixJ family response regulator
MLFSERAAAASGKFELTASNRAAVIDLCRRLDGVPLAIELAAVRTRLLSVEQILARLTDRFALLTGGGRAAIPRHQTLKATIDWSRNLLEPAEQALLSRLCVFAGRFTLDDAEAVCTFDDVSGVKAIDLLASLVDKSLVMKEDARGFASYRLHETMREYASAMLQEGGERDVVEARFADYYISKCQPSLSQARFALLEWLAWIDLEIDNVRSILRRCVIQGDFERGLVLAGSLLWYWTTRATTEGARWLDDLLASGSGNPELRGRAYFIRGFLAVLQSDPTVARPALQKAVAAARKAELQSLLSHSLSMASIAENIAGRRVAARRLFDQAAVVTTAANDVVAKLTFLQAQALNGLFEGDLESVTSAASEGVRLSRKTGDIYSLEMMLVNLGCVGIMTGDLNSSKLQLVEALEIAGQIDDRVAQFYVLEALVCQAAASGQARLAAQLLGASEALRVAAGGSVMATLAPLLDKAEKAAIAALGASKFESELAAGKRLSRDAAMTLALGKSPQPVAAASVDTGSELLGKRQAQVAGLIAEGLSNKQIGARLFISEYTVDSHVRAILNKLGFNSRAQIARWTAWNQER